MANYDARLRDRLVRIGENVREQRKTMGISQEQLADMAGLHRTYVGSVERGERNISVGNLLVLADALGTAPENLIKV